MADSKKPIPKIVDDAAPAPEDPQRLTDAEIKSVAAKRPPAPPPRRMIGSHGNSPFKKFFSKPSTASKPTPRRKK